MGLLSLLFSGFGLQEWMSDAFFFEGPRGVDFVCKVKTILLFKRVDFNWSDLLLLTLLYIETDK